MSTQQADDGVTRRQFMNLCGAAAGCAALTGMPAPNTRPVIAGPLDGTVAAWVRRRPGGAGCIVLGHRPDDSDTFRTLAVVPSDIAASPVELTTQARTAILELAARSWNVPAGACRLVEGCVIHRATRRRVGACVWLSL